VNGTLSERWHQFCLFILKQFYLNVLWILFTLFGLILFGIGPATVSMLAVQRLLIRGNETIKIFSTFIKHFKLHFKEATFLGVVYFLAGGVLMTNIIVIHNFYARLFYMVVAFFYLISLIYIGPVLIHFDLKDIRSKIIASLILGFSYLQYTLVLFLILIVAYAVIVLHYGLLTFFGASIGGYIVMYFANIVFVRAEIQAQEVAISNK
jgi:uncharacterized membrane protein YesL